jgi:hypothetical protein
MMISPGGLIRVGHRRAYSSPPDGDDRNAIRAHPHGQALELRIIGIPAADDP